MPEIPQAIADKAAAIQAQLNSAASSARNNSDLTPDGKRKVLAKAYLMAKQDMSALESSWRGTAATDSATLARDIFGAAAAGGQDAISSRDADDRAARLEDADEAAALLERAEENGDVVLARAIAQRAYRERGGLFGRHWAAVLDAYVETRPSLAEKLIRLEDARRDSMRLSLTAGMIFSLARPPEVGNATDGALAGLAGIG